MYDVGIIVGRFQVPDLHAAHLDLIKRVCDAHDKVIVFLGVSPLWSTRENPLDFQARKQMLLKAFPRLTVLYAKDVAIDELWSKNLDDQVRSHVSPAQSAVLYGGRDSFIQHYTGKYPTVELEQDVWISGTEVREGVARKSTRPSADFRAGAISSAFARYPTSFQTVDVAILSWDYSRLLLGRKPGEALFRFVGGFVDPSDASLEAAAEREAREETGLDVSYLTYLWSTRIDDWRYRRESDKIMTALFAALPQRESQEPRAADDLSEVRWFEVGFVNNNDVVPEHRELLATLVRSQWIRQQYASLDTDKTREH